MAVEKEGDRHSLDNREAVRVLREWGTPLVTDPKSL